MTVSIDNLTRHWSNSAQTLIGLGLNVIDTGHDANSRVFVLKFNGNTIFDVAANGQVTGNIATSSANVYNITGGNTSVQYVNAAAAGANNWTNTSLTIVFNKSNSAYDMANAAYIKANSINVTGGTTNIGPAYDKANSSYTLAGLAFDKANAVPVVDLSAANAWSNSLSITTGTAANNRAGLMANAANAYASAVGAASNAHASSLVSSPDLTPANNWANTISGIMSNAANSYADGLYAKVYVSDTAPGSPAANNLWWNSNTGTMYVYYNDGSSSQWVDANPSKYVYANTTYIPDYSAANNYANNVGLAANTYANTIVQTRGPVLLEQHAANNSATLDFTNWYSSDYDEYYIEFVNIVPASVTGLNVQCSTNAGASYDTTGANYLGGGVLSWQGGTGAQNLGGGAGYTLVTSGCSSNTTYGGVWGTFKLYTPASSTSYKCAAWDIGYFDNNGNPIKNSGSGTYKSISPVNAIRIAFMSGNITTGKVRIYGMPK